MAKGTKTLNHGIQVDDDGNVYVAVMDETPAGGQLDDGEILFYLDQGANKLEVKVKYEDGTVKTGSLALT